MNEFPAAYRRHRERQEIERDGIVGQEWHAEATSWGLPGRAETLRCILEVLLDLRDELQQVLQQGGKVDRDH